MRHADPARHAARGDCECVGDRWVGQPANTVTSAAYVVAAAVIARRAPLGALGLTAAGLGSAAYHGPGLTRDRWLHDLGVAMLGATAAAQMLRARRAQRPVVNRRAVAGAGLLTAAAVVHARSRSGRAWCAPDSLLQGHAAWHLLSAAGVMLLLDATTAEHTP